MKRYLVTGEKGFIGSRLLGLLENYKCSVSVLTRKINPNYESFICNLGSDKVPNDALKSIDTVFHLAGYAHDLKVSSKSNSFYYDVNVKATIELAEAAVANGVKTFIFISSTKAGGQVIKNRCANENDQSISNEIYGKTKREVELKLLDIGNNSNMNVIVIRPALVYGPGMKGNLQMMFSSIQNGFFPPLPETGNVKSMIHVDDLVRAIFFLSDNKKAENEIFIATDGLGYSASEIYKIMRHLVGKKIPKWFVPYSIFKMLSLIHPKIRFKVNKLFGEECYSSKKLHSLGFIPQKNLKDMNETSF